jgi:hypothetical protein
VIFKRKELSLVNKEQQLGNIRHRVHIHPNLKGIHASDALLESSNARETFRIHSNSISCFLTA